FPFGAAAVSTASSRPRTKRIPAVAPFRRRSPPRDALRPRERKSQRRTGHAERNGISRWPPRPPREPVEREPCRDSAVRPLPETVRAVPYRGPNSPGEGWEKGRYSFSAVVSRDWRCYSLKNFCSPGESHREGKR